LSQESRDSTLSRGFDKRAGQPNRQTQNYDS